MTVYIASALRERHGDVHFALKLALDDCGIPLVEVPSTNIWIRDWAPISTPSGQIKFRTKADTTKYPFLEVPETCWQKFELQDVHPGEILPALGMLSFAGKVRTSDLILDGGNVVRSPDGKRVIMTEQTLRDNHKHWILGELEGLLRAEIIWIPNEPDDELGHADGIVSWISDSICFLNDYRALRDPIWTTYGAEVERILAENGIVCVGMPNAYDICREISEERFRQEHPQADDFNMATGYYINYLKVGNLILYPTFGIDRDERCLDALMDAFPGADCRGIDCARLAEWGGLIHCVTWEC